MVDDDTGVELEYDNEEASTGKSLEAETDEGDSVLADQCAGSYSKAFSQSYHSINQPASVVGVID